MFGSVNGAMRIAITHPTCWPEVRRGSERLLHDLSHWLAARGHAVTVISTSERPTHEEQDGPVRRLLLARRHPLPFGTRWCSFFHLFGCQVHDVLADGGFDAVHCLNYHDACGAALARRRSRFRLVFQLTGIPMRRYFRRIPADGLIFRAALHQADSVLAISRFALLRLQGEYGRGASLVSAPTDLRPYAALLKRPQPVPSILFVGDANEPRKGAELLARAFVLLRLRGIAARLAYSGASGPDVRAAVLQAIPATLHADVRFYGVGRTEDLPDLLARAAVVVNPAVWEAQGMVLVEALAAGTPVVGCDHGGTPDVVNDSNIGCLFDPGPLGRASNNVEGLAASIVDALELATRPETAALCRARAAEFSWDEVGPAYEAALLGDARACGEEGRVPASRR